MPVNAALLAWADTPATRSEHCGVEVTAVSPPQQTSPEAPKIQQPTIQPQESTFAAMLYHLISTPRAARRFSAAYRELKSFVPTSAMAPFEGADGGLGQYQVPMLLLAIRIGAASAAGPLFLALQEYAERSEDLRPLLLTCGSITPAMAGLAMVQGIIRPIVADPGFPTAASLFRIWIPRVERYTFDMTGGPRYAWVPRAERIPAEPSVRNSQLRPD